MMHKGLQEPRPGRDMSEIRKRPQRAAATKSVNKNDGFTERDPGVESESDEPKPRRKARPPKKKAKTAKSDVAINTTSKGRRRNLSKLLDMPLDVLYEIFSALHPRDILSLSRTSRMFRETLSALNMRGVWRAALDQDGAPDCPSDWTEPRWTALLYDHNCQNCLAKSVLSTDYYIRRRLCFRCRKAVMLSEKKVQGSIWTHTDVQKIMDLTPKTTKVPNRNLSPSTNGFWHASDLEATDRKLESLKTDKIALEAWVKAELKLLEEIQTLAQKCRLWKSDKDRQRYAHEREITVQRFFDISERLRALGYSEDDVESIKWHNCVRIARPLAERSWGSVKTDLVAAIEVTREYRRIEALYSRYAERRRIVDNIYNNYKRDRTPFSCRTLPYTLALCLLPELKERIEADHDLDDTFSDVEERLPSLILAHEDMLRREAQSTLSNARSATAGTESDGPIDLNLATSVLVCCQCPTLIFGWSEHQQHKCTDRDEGISYQQTGVPLQNRTYQRPPLLSESVMEVIRLAGLDPTTATVESMDEVMADVYLRCIAHEPVGSGSSTYFSWRSSLHHCVYAAKHTSCQLERAPHNVVDTIKTRQSNFSQQSHIWYCNHCPHDTPSRPRIDCVQHLLVDHNIQDPIINADFFVFDPFLRHNKTSIRI